MKPPMRKRGLMQRIRLTIAYDGTNYVGWQSQPNGISVEETVTAALKKLLKEDVLLIGASRTDSGVHADGNVAVFDTESRIPGDKFKFALNEFLPDDIRVQDSEAVSLCYHPRKINSVKTYEYRILNRTLPLPKERNYAYFYYYPLDVEKMREASRCLLGEHDFKSFCSIRTSVEDTVRRIYSFDITKEGDIISFRISGNGFLYNMVRIIIGTLVKIGTGFWKPEMMKEILEARDRAKAGPRAPAMGLTLKSIVEEKVLEPLIDEENEHWSYLLEQDRTVSDKKAYGTIRACDEGDYEALLLRLTKQLSRNGAVWVYMKDLTGRLFEGKKADYFTFHEDENNWFVTADQRKLENTDWEND